MRCNYHDSRVFGLLIAEFLERLRYLIRVDRDFGQDISDFDVFLFVVGKTGVAKVHYHIWGNMLCAYRIHTAGGFHTERVVD